VCLGELAGLVLCEGHATGEVVADGAQDHGGAAGHILAAVGAATFDHHLDAGVANGERDLDQLLLEARQRPVLDQLGRRQRAQEVAEVIGPALRNSARGKILCECPLMADCVEKLPNE
jgi:hypothetical protein